MDRFVRVRRSDPRGAMERVGARSGTSHPPQSRRRVSACDGRADRL